MNILKGPKNELGMQYRVLQVVAIYEGTQRNGVKLNIVVSNVDEFRQNIKKLTGADKVKVTYEQVDSEDYLEEEEVIL